MKKHIVINIGNKGVILSIRNGNSIVDKDFIGIFNQESLPHVNVFFKKYKKLDAYIILDTVAQNYNYKIFPPLNYFDLQRIIERRFNAEIPRNDIKHKKLLYKNSVDKKTVVLFVSASLDSPIKEWINFFRTVSNNLLGIYMLPLETVDFAKSIVSSTGLKKQNKMKNKWILITFHDQISDLRQIAIFNNQIAFTRLISLDSAGDDLAQFAQNDIIRTSEYIKRFDNDFTFDKLTIITILDLENKEKLKNLKIEKSMMLHYTPFEVMKNLKLNGANINEKEKYTDILLSLFILKNKKKIRFGNTKINILYNLTKVIFALKTFLLFNILFIGISFFSYTFISLLYSGKISSLNKDIEKNKFALQNRSKDEFGMDTEMVDKIIDAGNLKSMLDIKYIDPVESFNRFFNAQDGIALTHLIKWTLDKFDYKSNDRYKTIITIYNMSIMNPDGDPNKLFTKYDSLSLKLKSIFNYELTSFTNIPANLNFSKKYLTYPIKVEITERR